MTPWPAALGIMIQICGWTLLHSLWQGALVAAIHAALRGSVRRGPARYALGLAALLALALAPLWTAWRLALALTATAVAPLAIQSGATAATLPVAATGLDIGAVLNATLPWLVLAWWLGVSLQALRALREWRRLRALLRQAVPLPAWQKRFAGLCRRLGIRGDVRLLGSGVSITPIVIGWLRPVVLLPLAVASGFPPAEVELILAHELAHIRRLDPLLNLLQVALETLLFYHPAVHWISRDVRREREVCCDALAVAVSGDARRDYLAALLRLEQAQTPALALAANGGVLLDRAQLIAGRAEPPRGASAAMRVALPLMILLAAAVALQWPHDHRLAQAGMVVRAGMPAPPRPALTWPNITVAPSVSPQLHLQATALAAVAPRPAAMAAPAPMAPVPAAAFETAAPALPSASPPAPPALMQQTAVPTPTARAAAVTAVVTPHVLHTQQPVYPDLAARRGIEGTVVLDFALTAEGRVRDARIVSANPAGVFDAAALAALHGWRFAPPPTQTANARYQQAFEFALTVAARHGAHRTLPAAADCRIVTGSHICRSLETIDDATLAPNSPRP